MRKPISILGAMSESTLFVFSKLAAPLVEIGLSIRVCLKSVGNVRIGFELIRLCTFSICCFPRSVVFPSYSVYRIPSQKEGLQSSPATMISFSFFIPLPLLLGLRNSAKRSSKRGYTPYAVATKLKERPTIYFVKSSLKANLLG